MNRKRNSNAHPEAATPPDRISGWWYGLSVGGLVLLGATQYEAEPTPYTVPPLEITSQNTPGFNPNPEPGMHSQIREPSVERFSEIADRHPEDMRLTALAAALLVCNETDIMLVLSDTGGKEAHTQMFSSSRLSARENLLLAEFSHLALVQYMETMLDPDPRGWYESFSDLYNDFRLAPDLGCATPPVQEAFPLRPVMRESIQEESQTF